MKIIYKFLIVMLCLTTISCGKAHTPLTGEWSSTINGLQVALRVPSSQIEIGKSVRVFAVFRNNGNTPCKLPVEPYYTVNQSHNGEPFADAIGNAKITKNEPVLRPGEERAFRLQGVRTDNKGLGIYSLEGGIGRMKFEKIEFEVK